MPSQKDLAMTIINAYIQALESDLLAAGLPILIVNISGLLSDGDIFHISGVRSDVKDPKTLESETLERILQYVGCLPDNQTLTRKH